MPESLSSPSHRDYYEQMAAALRLQDDPLAAEIEALMEPLLDGRMDLEAHRAFLCAQLTGEAQ